MAKLTAQFVSLNNAATYTIELTSAGIPADGQLILSKDPLHLVMPKPEDKYPGVRTIEAEINVLTRDSLAYLYSDNPLNTSVLIKRNGTTWFFGYLEPSQWQQPMTPGEWNEVQIVGIDALAALKNVPFRDRTLMCCAPDQYGTPSLVGLLRQYCGSDINVVPQTGLSGFMGAYFSSEAFIGTDIEDAEAYTTVGDMLQDFARAFGLTMIMRGKTLYIYKNDSESTNTAGDIKTMLADNNVDMEIVPPARSIKGSWDPIPDIDKPIAGTISRQRMNYGTSEELYSCYSTSSVNWEAHNPPSWRCLGSYPPILFKTADKSDVTTDKTSLFPGLAAREKADKVHIRVPGTMLTYNVSCEVHANHDRGEDYDSKLAASMPDDATSNCVKANITRLAVKLIVGDSEFSASTCNLKAYNEDPNDQKWLAYRFVFSTQNITSTELIKARGRVCVYVPKLESPPNYVRDLKFDELWSNDTYTSDIKLNTSEMLSDIDINTRLLADTSRTYKYPLGQMSTMYNPDSTNQSILSTANAMRRIGNQYRNAHTQWTATFDSSIINSMADMTKHVTFLNRRHTIQYMDLDCRNNEVELSILEDYE